MCLPEKCGNLLVSRTKVITSIETKSTSSYSLSFYVFSTRSMGGRLNLKATVKLTNTVL